MKRKGLVITAVSCLTFILSLYAVKDVTDNGAKAIFVAAASPEVHNITYPTYTSFGVPNIDSSFKTYMDYRTVTNKNSDQYKLIKTWGWSDDKGFMRANGERDLGIPDDYYMIALGSYYGTTIGTKYKITTDTGNVFYGILSDCKADRDTNSTHQYAYNKDVVEFLVDTRKLDKTVKVMGSANVYMPLNGKIASIERIDF